MVAMIILGWMVLGMPKTSSAHESPEHVVEFLDRQMAREGKTPLLLYQRATELRALGRLPEAVRDLEEANRLDSDFVLGRIELGRAYLTMEKPARALGVINAALEKFPQGAAGAPLYLVRAEIYLAEGKPAQALEDGDRAVAANPEDLDAYLLRGRVLYQLGRHEQAARGLREGFERTGSVVLEIAWMEALIDAGKYEEALGEIESQLEVSRWKSAWLLRRGRARLGLGRTEEARKDLAQAIREMDERINPGRPDVVMLAERGLAFLLLGEREKARRDYAAALSHWAEPWMLDRLADGLKRAP